MVLASQKVDEVHQILKIILSPEDYNEEVEKKIQQYRKNANIPGFRKGQVPFSLIRKNYRTIFISEQIKEILNKTIENYLLENSLKILGRPLQIHQDKITQEAQEFKFEFEIGLSPNFLLDLKQIRAVYYTIEVGEEEVKGLAVEMRGGWVRERAMARPTTPPPMTFANCQSHEWNGKKTSQSNDLCEWDLSPMAEGDS